MKTNISVEITDEERLKLGRRYHNTNNKRLLTRTELNDIVQNFVKSLVDYDGSIKQDTGKIVKGEWTKLYIYCLLYTSPSPRDGLLSRMPSSA